MPMFKTCPTCGHSTALSDSDFKEFSGESATQLAAAPLLAMPETVSEMVDGIIEASGYGGSVH